ncbi:uncharacterized protein LOC123531872 isoform X2 [Mercenaria mercenaria]|nr:uncharacterized protein LOC123531872 isoform X2 [Mercenaria mercenaria]XP_053373506.1 uncharacterized protein LOC123531872 isoform X2 [Mercenaria mercenaria]
MQAAVLTTCIIATCLLCGCDAQRRPFTYEQKPGLFGGIVGNGGMRGNGGSIGNGGLLSNGGLLRNGGVVGNAGQNAGIQSLLIQPVQVPDCPLEIHPDTETMFVMRSPLGDPEPRTCPPGTYFLRSVCSCVNRPLDSKECNLRPSAQGQGWYEENVFGLWVQRPCGPGSAYNPSTCDCSFTL